MGKNPGTILLTFTGFHDPYGQGPVEGSRQPGPILSLLGERSFTRVYLLSTPAMTEETERTRDAVREAHPGTGVTIRHLSLPDPTDYGAILREIRGVIREVVASPFDEICVATASGTPHMHACWVLLASSGELPARLLHVRPPRFVSRTSPLVTEVDLSIEDFQPFEASLAMARMEATAPVETDLSVLCEEAGVVGDDPAFVRALERAVAVAPYHEPVLIQGENGSGKEIVARLIHRMSPRSGERLVTVNCSAIPEELAESILFGHARGAFTGAVRDEPGKFRLADGGTLFLDEVGELSPAIQAKLLRAVENQVIEPLGEGREVKVDIRLVTATNRDLAARVEEGTFRADLYYRLKGARIEIPPLRRRRGDISRLAVHFLEQFGGRYGKRWVFTSGALRRLQHHHWPGNVRELEHAVREAAILCGGTRIEPEHLELLPRNRDSGIPEPHHGFSLEEYLSETRRRLFERALEIAEGNQAEAARLLGVTPAAVSKYRKADRRESR
jgi:transcriptional regulator with GAF, ATPase, and Fis domain